MPEPGQDVHAAGHDPGKVLHLPGSVDAFTAFPDRIGRPVRCTPDCD